MKTIGCSLFRIDSQIENHQLTMQSFEEWPKRFLILCSSVDPLLLDGGVLCVARGPRGCEAPQGDRAAQVLPLRQRPSQSRPHREEENPHVLGINLAKFIQKD